MAQFQTTTLTASANDLVNSGRNRQLDAKNLKKIIDSISMVGQKHAVQINTKGEIIDGHHRVEACKVLNIPVKIYVDDNEPEGIRDFNHSKAWNLQNFLYTGKNIAVLHKMEQYGIPVNVIEYILNVRSKKLKSDEVIAEEMSEFEKLDDYIFKVFLPIKQGLEYVKTPQGKKVKANRSFYKCLVHFYELEGLNIERLVNKAIENSYSINLNGSEHEILNAICSAYNFSLKGATPKIYVLEDNSIGYDDRKSGK